MQFKRGRFSSQLSSTILGAFSFLWNQSRFPREAMLAIIFSKIIFAGNVNFTEEYKCTTYIHTFLQLYNRFYLIHVYIFWVWMWINQEIWYKENWCIEQFIVWIKIFIVFAVAFKTLMLRFNGWLSYKAYCISVNFRLRDWIESRNTYLCCTQCVYNS